MNFKRAGRAQWKVYRGEVLVIHFRGRLIVLEGPAIPVWLFIDGSRNIRELSRLTGTSPLAVEKILRRLTEAGVLKRI